MSMSRYTLWRSHNDESPNDAFLRTYSRR